ncbi:hypothetical protein [Oricola sp.]|uniref:hypothetical protein n=1 Tax=Oricola sp. TaxID=1979950 RepID=UPI0025FA0B8E|nr:hypothetical protein [Oricola sp.]MCI5077992.1 hypothetical protein [Oricola sp.]
MKTSLPILLPIFLVLLAGCSTSSVLEDSQSMPTRQQAARVQVVDSVPEKVGRFSNLSATLCRGDSFEGPPSRDNALLLLKMRAFANGFLFLHSVSVGPLDGSIADTCAGGVRAQGVGFTPAKDG